MTHRIASFAVIGLLGLCGTVLAGQDQGASVNTTIVRFAPSRFPALPPAIRRDLERRRCLIPQLDSALGVPGPRNVITGAFTTVKSVDWAVLCSIRNTSRILVYRGAAGVATDSFAKRDDNGEMQMTGAGHSAFSRAIGVATAAWIRQQAAAFRGPTPPAILDHAGIDDAFVGKASVIYYFHGGQWRLLQGAG